MLNKLSTAAWRRMWEWKYSSTILDFGTRWSWVVSFTTRPFYPRRKTSPAVLVGKKGWWATTPVWTLWSRHKSLVPAGNRTPVVQLVAIDWAIPCLLTHGAEPFLRSHSRTSQHFMELEGSIPCSQEPSTGSYPKPYQPKPHHPILSF
jgi:hypothetical protein